MFKNLNYELSEYLKLLRFKSKQSQEDVAKILNVTRNTYNSWENNPISLSLETLNNIANVFNEHITYFFKNYVANSNEKVQLTEKEE